MKKANYNPKYHVKHPTRYVPTNHARGFEPMVWFNPFVVPQTIAGTVDDFWEKEKKNKKGSYTVRYVKIRTKKGLVAMQLNGLLAKAMEETPRGTRVELVFAGLQDKESKEMVSKKIKDFKALKRAHPAGTWECWSKMFC